MVVSGYGGYSLDSWAVKKKAEMDARAIPPPLPKEVTKPPIPPAIAFLKTAKRPPKAPINVVVGDQNVTGNKITGGQVCPGGICAGGDITGSPSVTTIIAPPDRHLTQGQVDVLLKKLQTSEGHNFGGVWSVSGDTEASGYVQDFQNVFKQVGWDTSKGGWVIPREPIYGIWVIVAPEDKDSPPEGTNETFVVLKEIDRTVQVMTFPRVAGIGLQPGQFGLFIGLRPRDQHKD
jgi:hypothetical protein